MAAAPVKRSQPEAIRQIIIALLWGSICHVIFALAVLSMIAAMWFGMSQSFGAVPQPWGWVANIALLLQFALTHSLLLTRRGRAFLEALAPVETGRTLATTTYAIIASLQLLALFALWTPSGVIWWEASSPALWLITLLYTGSWLLLIKASCDAGAEVQSGLLGWASLLRGVRPQFPPMPTTGLFQIVRQPIYVSFALTTWCVPTWTPDQLLLATVLTAYCAIGPLAKERRFARIYADRWETYRASHPYWIPSPRSFFNRRSKNPAVERHYENHNRF
jgi:protein-S-isoprenylcysteine O-methyltransferase Ste14